MDPQLQELLDLLERLSDQFAELRDGILKAVRGADNDPEMALTRARKMLEFVIRDVFERRIGEPPGTRPLENLVQRLAKDGHIPARVEAYTETIRKLGNVGAHRFGEAITTADVHQSLVQLLPILEWYFENERPGIKVRPGPKRPPEEETAGPTHVTPPQVVSPEPHWSQPTVLIAVAGVVLAGFVTLLAVFRAKGPARAPGRDDVPAPPVASERSADRTVETPPSRSPDVGRTVETPPSRSPDADRRPPDGPPAAAGDGFLSLFNGTDTSGWRLAGNPRHTWRVEGGILTGSSGPNPASYLLTERRDFMNFHLRVETMVCQGVSRFIRFRVDETDVTRPRFFSVVIEGTRHEARKFPTTIGTLIHIDDLERPTTLAEADPAVAIRPNEWFVVEVIAEGDLIRVRVRGTEVVRYHVRRIKSAPGAIGLACPPNSRVAFRKVEIKKL
jgi:hypothetical protein